MPFPAGWRGYPAFIQRRCDSARGQVSELDEDRTQLLGAICRIVAILDALGVQPA